MRKKLKKSKRSVFSEISEDDLKKTIILNSKVLIEKDGDFAKFSARILLSYMYEESGVEHCGKFY